MKGKKLVSFVLSFVIIATILPARVYANSNANDAVPNSTYKDVPAGSIYKDAIERLTALEIMNGHEGYFDPDMPITKEQFAVIMVNASGLKDKAMAYRGASVFWDVDENRWSCPYINAAVAAGLISGTTDGSFRPEDKVTLAMAATVMLKALGYTDNDVVGVWPRNYVEKARSLKLLEGIDAGYNDELTRGMIAMMIDRMLTAKTVVNGNASSVSYAEKSGLGSVQEKIITSTGGLDPALADYKIRTDGGEYTTTGINLDSYLGHKVKLLVDDDGKVVGVLNVVTPAKSYVVNNIVGNTVKYLTEDKENSLYLPDNLTMYYRGEKRTFKDIQANIAIGSIISLSYNQQKPDAYEYGVLVDPDLGSPVVVPEDVLPSHTQIGSIDISDKENIIVLKNNSLSELSDIKANDVIYRYKNMYSPKTYLFVYDDRVTGRYDEAIPGKATVNKIKVNGKVLDIEVPDVVRKLDNSRGAFQIGDRITVLLGKDGKVVDVMSPYSISLDNYAVVVSTGRGVSNEEDTLGKTVYYVDLFKMDGTRTGNLEAVSDFSGLKGQLVRYEFNNDKVELWAIPGSTVTGQVDRYNRRIGDTWLTDDAVLLDLVSGKNSGSAADVRLLDWSDIPSMVITPENVISVIKTGPFEDAQVILFNNILQRKGKGQYGVVSNVDERSKSIQVTVGANGAAVTVNNYAVNNIVRGDAVYINYDENDKPVSVVPLLPTEVSGSVQAVDKKRIKVENTVYLLASDVIVFRDVSNYSDATVITPTEIKTDGSVVVRLYMDKNTASGGKVRVITVTTR